MKYNIEAYTQNNVVIEQHFTTKEKNKYSYK